MSVSLPTTETYAELQLAYEHFNKTLFDNRLPACLITLQQKVVRSPVIVCLITLLKMGHMKKLAVPC